jgi:hypothetical protein
VNDAPSAIRNAIVGQARAGPDRSSHLDCGSGITATLIIGGISLHHAIVMPGRATQLVLRLQKFYGSGGLNPATFRVTGPYDLRRP